MEPKKMNTSFLYVTVLTILLSLGLALFLRSNAFAVQRVSVQGLNLITENEILKLSDGIQGQNLLLFDRKALEYKISLHPLVKSVQFQRKLPQTLVIQVTERTPAALVVVPRGVLEVDSEGTFLRRLESWPKSDYPVISGIELSDTVGPGQNLANPLLNAALRLLGQAPPELVIQIGELNVNAIEQITLFLTSGVEVRLGQANDWADKLQALYQLISDNGYTSIQQGVRYIDFTAAKPVIGR
ncbi:cell division protein FtsQ/DivIB [Desulfosporosinus nitroreducens]|uniref:FtsQ-type POTRA domain-containing protein n=1 Tax=Desulfosporosinus nitroreducens TaxID=2018668 RepID=A0ABT8QK80_9FIRM|nr:FtsQ-type POTRA domain-containing protein [Desulfosporosinus nitroreducens]MCO1601236.1 FtsQ-type POTRA domain-containing protein [Desulfosporosinus nitroreducens]MDO0821738.1 FtsQ-type POTRA domain-containing protein [Desulfosporosinus nitroreducens]